LTSCCAFSIAKSASSRQPIPKEMRAGLPQAPRRKARTSYQLTHDYLVPPLREWLTRKQKETRRGARVAPGGSGLPSGMPDRRMANCRRCPMVAIRWLTRKIAWTLPERKMMRKATGYHVVRGLLFALRRVLCYLAGFEVYGPGAGPQPAGTAARRPVRTRCRRLCAEMTSYRRGWIRFCLRICPRHSKPRTWPRSGPKAIEPRRRPVCRRTTRHFATWAAGCSMPSLRSSP